MGLGVAGGGGMALYVYVDIYVCMYIDIHLYVYTYICIHMHRCTSTCIYVCGYMVLLAY